MVPKIDDKFGTTKIEFTFFIYIDAYSFDKNCLKYPGIGLQQYHVSIEPLEWLASKTWKIL